MEEGKDKLAKAVINVIKAVKGVEKTLTVGTGQAAYKGVSDKEVKKVVGEAMAKEGLCILPIEVIPTLNIDRWDEEAYDNYQKKNVIKRKQSVFTEIRTKYLLLHESGQSQVIEGYGHGVDSQDKSAGKATTYALKYALLYSFLVPTGDIDDADHTHSNEIALAEKKQAEINLKFNESVKLAIHSFTKAESIDELKELKGSFEEAIIKHPDVVLAAKRTFESLSKGIVPEKPTEATEANPEGLLKKDAEKVEPIEPKVEEKPVDLEMEQLLAKYFEIFKVKPHHKASKETIMNKIEEYHAEQEAKANPIPVIDLSTDVEEAQVEEIVETKKDDEFLTEMNEMKVEETVETKEEPDTSMPSYLDTLIKAGKAFTVQSSMVAWWNGNKATFQERLTPEEWKTLNAEFKSHYDSIKPAQ